MLQQRVVLRQGIVGVSALIYPIACAPGSLHLNAPVLISATFLLVLIGLAGVVTTWVALPMLALLIVFSVVSYRTERRSAAEAARHDTEVKEFEDGQRSLPACIFALIGGLIGGLLGGLSYGLHRGGSAVAKHCALRLILWLKGYTPFRFIGFLDHCAKLILLKKVGGGYIFMHRMLLEYFAGLNSEGAEDWVEETTQSAPIPQA